MFLAGLSAVYASIFTVHTSKTLVFVTFNCFQRKVMLEACM